MCLYLESVWPSQSEPAALCSGGRRGSEGSAGCCRWSNRPHWPSVVQALLAADGRSPCSLKDRKCQTGYAAGSWGELEEPENLLLLTVEGYGLLGYKLNPVSTRRLYFCRPPLTRSKRTPARQRTNFPFQLPPLCHPLK